MSALDALTGGAFSAATAGERASRLNHWLTTQPTHDQLQAVFTEMSHRDKGAAKLVREKLDEARKAKDQDALIQEWTRKGEALRDAARINLADAMAWQRDAAKAVSPPCSVRSAQAVAMPLSRSAFSWACTSMEVSRMAHLLPA